MDRLSPAERLARYGPTTGDEVRLGDTDLWIRVGEDRQAPGDEPIWGYAKTMRPHAAQGRATASELDVVVAGALVVDPVLGVVKADIGIKDGRIVGVGRAGNPGISDGIELPIGPHTQPVMGYGLIATPGAIDSHVHLISPELLPAALSGGVTTLITAGFEEPPYAMARVLDATAAWPLNIGLQACARAEDDGSFQTLLDAGACGFKIHEDYGADPGLIDHTLRFAEAHDVSVSLHTDGLHEIGGARGHGRRDRRPHGPCLSRRGERRWPRARRHRARPRAEHPVLVHDADGAVRRQRRRGAGPDDRPQPRRRRSASPRRRARPGTGPRGDDGRRGPAPRARRDRHRELRLAGDGPDPRDRPAHGPARPREAWRATEAGAASGLPDEATTTTTPASCATWPRSRSSRRSPTASPTTSARSRPAGWPTSSSGSQRTSGSSPSSCSRPASRPGRRSARATPPSSAPSRPATDPTGAGLAGGGAIALSDVRLGAAVDGAAVTRGGGRQVIAVRGTRGLTRASLARNRATTADRGRRPGRHGHARRRAPGGRAGRRGPAEPPLPPALGRSRLGSAVAVRSGDAGGPAATRAPSVRAWHRSSPTRSTTSRRRQRAAWTAACRRRHGSCPPRRSRSRSGRRVASRRQRPRPRGSPPDRSFADGCRRSGAPGAWSVRCGHAPITQIGMRGCWTGVGRNVISPNR